MIVILEILNKRIGHLTEPLRIYIELGNIEMCKDYFQMSDFRQAYISKEYHHLFSVISQ